MRARVAIGGGSQAAREPRRGWEKGSEGSDGLLQGPGSGQALGWQRQGDESTHGQAQSSPHQYWGCCSILGSGGSRPLGRERCEFILAGCGTGPSPAVSAAAGGSHPRSKGGWHAGAPPVLGSPAKSSPQHTHLLCLPKLPARVARAKRTRRGFSPAAPTCCPGSRAVTEAAARQLAGTVTGQCQLFPCHPAPTAAGHPTAGGSRGLPVWGHG